MTVSDRVLLNQHVSPPFTNSTRKPTSSPTKLSQSVKAWALEFSAPKKGVFFPNNSELATTAIKTSTVSSQTFNTTSFSTSNTKIAKEGKQNLFIDIEKVTTDHSLEATQNERPASPLQDAKIKNSMAVRAKFSHGVRQILALSRGVDKGATRLHESYYFEALTRQHYYGQDLIQFIEVWKESDSKDNFLTWFSDVLNKTQVSGTQKLKELHLINENNEIITTLRKVKYLDPHERRAYKAYIDEHKQICTLEQHGALDSELYGKENPFIFVIGRDNELYTGVYQRGEIHHSSFFGGAPVMSAGVMIFQKGKLLQITDKTGHYTVSKELIQKGLEILANKGYDLSSVTVTLNSWTGCKEKPVQYKALDLLDEWLRHKTK